MNVKEEDLIEYIKPLLKVQGFKKKAKRWTKVTDHFTYIFFIVDGHIHPPVWPFSKACSMCRGLKPLSPKINQSNKYHLSFLLQVVCQIDFRFSHCCEWFNQVVMSPLLTKSYLS